MSHEAAINKGSYSSGTAHTDFNNLLLFLFLFLNALCPLPALLLSSHMYEIGLSYIFLFML
jgi:hypothetical protein